MYPLLGLSFSGISFGALALYFDLDAAEVGHIGVIVDLFACLYTLLTAFKVVRDSLDTPSVEGEYQ